METQKPIEIKINSDQTLIISELIKTQAYILSLANVLLNKEQLIIFDQSVMKESELLLKLFLEENKDLLKK